MAGNKRKWYNIEMMGEEIAYHIQLHTHKTSFMQQLLYYYYSTSKYCLKIQLEKHSIRHYFMNEIQKFEANSAYELTLNIKENL